MTSCVSCISGSTCKSTPAPRLYSETQSSIKNTLLTLGVILELGQSYSDSINVLFDTWTNENFITQVNTLLFVLSTLKTPFGSLIPGFDSIFDTLLLGFGGYLQVVTQFPSPLKEGSIDSALVKLNKFWLIFVADIEDGVDYARSLASIDPFIGQIVSGFPQYPSPTLSESCHSTYNDLIGDSGIVLRPNSQDELQNILKDKNYKTKKIRPISETSYSFNDLVKVNNPDDLYVSLIKLNKILEIDTQNNTIRVEAGAKLKTINNELQKIGKALKNMGNWDDQTIAGTLSTAVHGSNSKEADSMTDICIEIVGYNSLGRKKIFKSHEKIFDAVSCSFGQIVIITEVVLKIVDSYDVNTKVTLDGNSSTFDVNTWLNLIETEPLTEVDYFPSIDLFSLRRRTIGPNVQPVDSTKPYSDKLTGLLREILVTLSAGILDIPGFPLPSQPRVQFQQALIQGAVTPSESTLPWLQGLLNNHVYGRSFPQSINNAEYAFDFTNSTKITEVINKLKSINSEYYETLITTFRVQGASKSLLAPHNGNKTLYLDIGFYNPNITQEQIKYVENEMISIGGRPHWGKWLCMNNDELYSLYPRKNIALFKIYSKLNDPRNRFENAFIERVFKSRDPSDDDYELCADEDVNLE